MNNRKEANKLKLQNKVGVMTFFSLSEVTHCTTSREENKIWAIKPML
jgi:hypothetical protein